MGAPIVSVLLAFGGCQVLGWAAAKGEQDKAKKKAVKPVSYTHLTLPTIYSV